MSRQVTIIPAVPEDADLLSEICVAAKSYWGYPQEWMREWGDLLRVTPAYIQEHSVYKGLVDGSVVGWYALVGAGELVVLDHLWVQPAHIRQGIGQALFQHALQTAAGLGAKKMEIESDPNARGFYEKMGARVVRYVQSGIERQLPYLEISLEKR